MYKSSFALACVLAMADAIYLNQCCNICAGGDDEKPEEKPDEQPDEQLDLKLEELPEFMLEELPEFSLGAAPEEPESACYTESEKFFEKIGLSEINSQIFEAKVDYLYTNNEMSIREANFWYSWFV